MKHLGHAAILLVFQQFAPCFADSNQMTAADLIEMDFAELVNMDVEIESAGKSSSRAMDLPYAAAVISARDISQSGATTIPDALRLAPGMAVGQISSGEWSIGIRGGEGRFSRYVLVMIDGRIVYNSVFSGVNWDELNVTLANIDRIEVIRGPNAAAWGANAVNGIIHIITKNPGASAGSYLNAWGGMNEHYGVSAAGLVSVADDWALKLSAHSQQWGGMKTKSGGAREAAHKDWRLTASLGKESDTHTTRLMAEMFGVQQTTSWGWEDVGTLSSLTSDNREDKSGWAAQFVHQESMLTSGHWKVRASVDNMARDSDLYHWDSANYQLDVEIGADWRNHSFNMGVNSRKNESTAIGTSAFTLSFTPETRELGYLGVYLSDQWRLSQSLELTLAARYDDNEVGESNLQPSARLLWSPSESTRVWMAVSEAATSTSRALGDINDVTYAIIPPEDAGTPYPVVIVLDGYEAGNSDTRVQALEMGYRQTFSNFNVDIALFDFSYRDDVTVVVSDESILHFDENYQPHYLEVSANFANIVDFSSYGGEITMRGKFTERWTAQLALSRIKRRSEFSDWGTKASFLNAIQLSDKWQWNIWLRYSDGESGAGVEFSKLRGLAELDSYAVADINLSWAVTSDIQLTLATENLGQEHTEARREEFLTELRVVEPLALLKADFKF